MISPFTPPGTKIVCVDNAPDGKYNAVPASKYRRGMDGLAKHAVYTARKIHIEPTAASGFNVEVEEIARVGNLKGFDLARFRYLHLPRSLTDLLETAPTRAPSELEPTQ